MAGLDPVPSRRDRTHRGAPTPGCADRAPRGLGRSSSGPDVDVRGPVSASCLFPRAPPRSAGTRGREREDPGEWAPGPGEWTRGPGGRGRGRGDWAKWTRGPGGVGAGTWGRGRGRGDWAKWTQGPGEWTRGLGEVDAGTPGSGRGRKGRQAGDVLRARPEPAERWLRVGEPLPRRESPGVWVFRCSDPVPCARCPESGGGWTQTLGFK